MSVLEAILQGILQGITEFLPISSDGHLSVFQHITNNTQADPLLFTVLLHLGTLLAVCICYRKKIGKLILEFVAMCKDIFTGKFSYKAMSHNRRFVVMIFVSLIPLLPLYFLSDFMEGLANDKNLYAEAFCFMFSGVMMFIAARSAKKNSTNHFISFKIALLMGIFQGIAALPGVSRSGSTIAIALLLGLSKNTAVEFSFIMGVPAIIGANLFKIMGAVKDGEIMNIEMAPIIIGIIISAVVGIFAIKLLNILVKKDKFHIFGYYCIALGVICLIVSIAESAIGRNLFTAAGA